MAGAGEPGEILAPGYLLILYAHSGMKSLRPSRHKAKISPGKKSLRLNTNISPAQHDADAIGTVTDADALMLTRYRRWRGRLGHMAPGCGMMPDVPYGQGD